MATSRSNPIIPNPCESSPEEIENFTNIREMFEQVFPKLGCATANWSMTGGFYPSHPSYPSCPTKAQLCTVAVTYGGENFTVLLPCPRNRDPNFESGDSVLFQQDVDKDPIYIGGHDDLIGSVKWFEGLPAEVPRGWRWLNGSTPPAGTHTRTGKWTNATDKYVKNKWAVTGPDPVFGTLGTNCSTSSVDVTVSGASAPANANITIDGHAPQLTSLDDTNITVGHDFYIGKACLYGDGTINIDHFHRIDPLDIEISVSSAPPSSPATVASKDPFCSSHASGDQQNCTSPITPVPFYLDLGCHDHYLYGNVFWTDPGHQHDTPSLSHNVNQTPHTHDILVSGTGDNVKIPRVYMLLIERYNNAANATSGAVDGGVFCD